MGDDTLPTQESSKLLSPAPEPVAAVFSDTISASPRGKDWLELTKPRIATMALITVGAGYLLAAAGQFQWQDFVIVLIGAGMVAAGGSALNHAWEREVDAAMLRTRGRPLPSGRIQPSQAVLFGLALVVLGTLLLGFGLPTMGAAVAAGSTAALYVLVYTPLKRRSSWNTIVGAIPGALPPLIGWLAARPELDAEACSLFLILFVWQLPHFYSIAFMYRDDYARGGMKMLPVIEPAAGAGRVTGWATFGTAALLLLVTPLPYLVGSAGLVYAVGSMGLATWFMLRCWKFAQERNLQRARVVLKSSIVYLCGVMLLLGVNGILPHYW